MIKRILITISVTLLFLLSIKLCFNAEIHTINGNSMFPAVAHGDYCITFSKILDRDPSIKRGSIVVIEKPDGLILKRVVAIPGDTVTIKKGVLRINGIPQKERYILSERTEGSIHLTLEDNKYYVLGDNRKNSLDSRILGPIDKSKIRGILFLKCTNPIML